METMRIRSGAGDGCRDAGLVMAGAAEVVMMRAFYSRSHSVEMRRHERVVVQVRIAAVDAVDLLALAGAQRLVRVEAAIAVSSPWRRSTS